MICRTILGNAIRRKGFPKAETCEYPTCNSNKVEAHHWDYNKPYDVVWFCKKHHVLADRIYKLLSHDQCR